jgi:hypothetical protein
VTVADSPANEAPYRLLNDVEFGLGVVVHPFTNLYGCRIGDESQIGPFVEIQSGVEIGARCKIQSHSFICSGVTLADEVFVGHGVLFINDKRPRATADDGELQTADDWTLLPTLVERGASLGVRRPRRRPHRRGGARRRRRRRHPRRRRGRARHRDSRARRGRREGAMRCS